MFAVRSGLAVIAGCCFTVGLLVGCGNQSANAPPSNAAPSNAADAQASPPPAPPPPASATQPPEGQQNASVAELLAGSTAPANPPPPSEPAAAPVVAGSEPVADSAAAGADGVEFARVISVRKIPGPKQICTDQTVVERREPEDKHKVAGTVIGAVAGGVIGSQFGGGRGRTVATVGGAVAGGAIGRKVQGNHQDQDTVTRVVKHCRPATKEEEGQVLYDVVYAYQGQNLHVRLDRDPGDRIELPVRAGPAWRKFAGRWLITHAPHEKRATLIMALNSSSMLMSPPPPPPPPPSLDPVCLASAPSPFANGCDGVAAQNRCLS